MTLLGFNIHTFLIIDHVFEIWITITIVLHMLNAVQFNVCIPVFIVNMNSIFRDIWLHMIPCSRTLQISRPWVQFPHTNTTIHTNLLDEMSCQRRVCKH